MAFPFNPIAVPTAALAAALFAVGLLVSKGITSIAAMLICVGLGSILALPWLLFALDYRYAIDIGVWFYESRALPASELAAAGAGLLFGFIHHRIARVPTRRLMPAKWFFTILFFAVLLSPYVNLVLSPVQWWDTPDRWSDGVCMQTSEASCGPCAVATVLRLYGHAASEREIARETHTDSGGTLPHDMIRALRRRSLAVSVLLLEDPRDTLPSPSIACVRLPSLAGIKHFIVVFHHADDEYTIGDPLLGRLTIPAEKLYRDYPPTGLCLSIEDETPPPID